MADRQPREAGLTIIELLIVLAVAGLILLIVLMAIPALLRNSRNNQRKQDVQAVLAAVSSYKLNNSGALPGFSSNFLQYTKLYLYNPANVIVIPQSPVITPISQSNNNLNTVRVYDYRKCSTTSPGYSTNKGAGFGDVVALYAIETASGRSRQCQQM